MNRVFNYLMPLRRLLPPVAAKLIIHSILVAVVITMLVTWLEKRATVPPLTPGTDLLMFYFCILLIGGLHLWALQKFQPLRGSYQNLNECLFTIGITVLGWSIISLTFSYPGRFISAFHWGIIMVGLPYTLFRAYTAYQDIPLAVLPTLYPEINPYDNGLLLVLERGKHGIELVFEDHTDDMRPLPEKEGLDAPVNLEQVRLADFFYGFLQIYSKQTDNHISASYSSPGEDREQYYGWQFFQRSWLRKRYFDPGKTFEENNIHYSWKNVDDKYGRRRLRVATIMVCRTY